MVAWNGARSASMGLLLLTANFGPANARDNSAVGDPPTVQIARDSARGDMVERQLLDAHNAERLRLGLKPLEWSENLAEEARNWAEQLARIDDLEHSDNSERVNIGENLWMGSKGDFSPQEMVDGFIDERKDFTPGTFPDVSATGDWIDVGHYTQLIWPDTRELGCGIAHNRQSDVLVCRYYPTGNVEGERVP